MKSHPILFLSFTGRISSSGFAKASKCPGISGREIAMICMNKKLMSEPLWDDDTWCSSHPVRESKEKVMQHSQLALMDCTQVLLEITEGEGPHPQGNGRMRKKSILSREETPPQHHNKREWCTQEKQIPQWDAATSKLLSRLTSLLDNMEVKWSSPSGFGAGGKCSQHHFSPKCPKVGRRGSDCSGSTQESLLTSMLCL